MIGKWAHISFGSKKCGHSFADITIRIKKSFSRNTNENKLKMSRYLFKRLERWRKFNCEKMCKARTTHFFSSLPNMLIQKSLLFFSRKEEIKSNIFWNSFQLNFDNAKNNRWRATGAFQIWYDFILIFFLPSIRPHPRSSPIGLQSSDNKSRAAQVNEKEKLQYVIHERFALGIGKRKWNEKKKLDATEITSEWTTMYCLPWKLVAGEIFQRQEA